MASTKDRDWVIVTGGNRGLGYDLCLKLVQAGRPVLLCSRDVEKGNEAAYKIESETGARGFCVPIRLDVSDAEDIKRFIEEIGEKYDQRIHALVNNAGVSSFGWTQELFDSTMAVNFSGPVALAIGLAPHIVRGGRIVNVTSGIGMLPSLHDSYRSRIERALSLQELGLMPFEEDEAVGIKPTYAVTKAMINKATKLMTQHEAFKHLSVNSANPGWCRTDMGGKAAWRSLEQGTLSILAVLNKPAEVRGAVFIDGKEWRPGTF